MARRALQPVTVSAEGADAEWRAVDVRTNADGGQHFVAVDPDGQRHEVDIRLPGRYNVTNALLALALLHATGVTPEHAAAGLARATVPGRLESVDRGESFIALVDYA